jgi:threonine synthase
MREYTTANSINLGRLLPQIAFHAWGIAQYLRLPPAGSPAPPPAIVVPSGNFGNLTACLYAREMGIPMGKVVAATNSNDAGAEFLRTGTLLPKRAIPTPSSAMDVGNPSNVARLEALFRSPAGRTGTRPEAFSIAEEQTVGEIRRTFERSGVVVDPHTAVGLAAARRLGRTQPVIVAATAHPAKFPDVIERATGVPVPLPEPLAIALRSAGTSVALPSDYASFKEYLLGQE